MLILTCYNDTYSPLYTQASDLLLRMNPNDLTPDERGRLRQYAHHFSSDTSTENNQEPAAPPTPIPPSRKRKSRPSSEPTTTEDPSTPQSPPNTNTRESASDNGDGPSKRRRGRPLGSLNRSRQKRASLSSTSGFDENENEIG